jgi:CheY-like chemotaxis protein
MGHTERLSYQETMVTRKMIGEKDGSCKMGRRAGRPASHFHSFYARIKLMEGRMGFSKKKILLVEDEKILRMLYEEELGEEGFEVAAVKSGEEALQRLDKAVPDLIILDIVLPGIDGLETLAKIRERVNGTPRVILHTSHEKYQFDSKSRLADAYIIKSGDLSELKEKARQLLGIG